MNIVFLSNYMNHHQLPLSLEFLNLGVDYTFIATIPIAEERLKLGYEDMNKKHSFILRAYENLENRNKALTLCEMADIVIIGSAPEEYVFSRLKKGKITFKYSERILKQSLLKFFLPRLFFRAIYNRISPQNKNYFLLSASAYAPYDFNLLGYFKNRCYKWGYFPKNISYDVDNLLEKKEKNDEIILLWCGRLIDWKHPEKMIYIAQKLKSKKVKFKIIIIGTGNMDKSLKRKVIQKKLSNEIEFAGAIPANSVRNYMEKANIFISTSDYNEGWGAVLNEAMNSCCAIVASHAIGSVPFLIRNNWNGLIYKNNSNKDLFCKIYNLIENRSLRLELSKNAYLTISREWNAKKAATNFIKLYNALKKCDDADIKSGPCSIALSISQWNMYKKLK